MSPSCPGPDLLLMHREGLIEETDDGGVQAHLAVCASCQGQLQKLGEALDPPPLPFPSSELLAGIHARIEAARVEHGVREHLPELDGVRVLCTFCKDELGGQPIYCADCLAPYHDDCFAEHGRCAIQGCEGREVVRRSAAPVLLPPQRGRRRLLWAALVCGGVAAAVAAAWPGGDDPAGLGGPLDAEVPQRPSEAPTPAADLAYEPAQYAVGDLLAEVHPEWVKHTRALLRTRRATYVFAESALGDAVGFVSETSGVKVKLHDDVDPGRKVTLRCAGIPLADALEALADDASLRVSLDREGVVLSPPGDWFVGLPLRASFDERLEPADLEAEIRAAVREDLGPEAWAAPASLDLRGECLVVVQSSAGHSAVRSLIGALRSTWLRDLEQAWFLATEGERPPLATGFEEQLQEPISVDYRGETALAEALGVLSERSGVPFRLTPKARAACAQSEGGVSLRVKDVAVSNAVALVLAQSGLEYDVSQLGVQIRASDELPLAERLDRLARRSLRMRACVTDRLRNAAPAAPRLEDPFGDAAWGVTVPEFVERVRAVLGVRVVFSPRDRACRARLAIPAGQSVGQALELALAQASLASAWIELEGESFLALGPVEPEVLLAAVRAAERPSPWPAAPLTARDASTRGQVLLREVLRRLAAWRAESVEPAEFRLQLTLLRELLHQCQDVRRGQAALAALDAERDRLGAAFREHQTVLAADWTWRSDRLARLEERVAGADLAPSGYDALAIKRTELEGQAWDTVFPEGYASWRDAARSRGGDLRRGFRCLQELGVAVDDDAVVIALEPGGLAQACGLRVGERVRVRREPVAGALRLLESLGRVQERVLDLGVGSGADGRSLRIPLRPHTGEERGSLPLRAGDDGAVVVTEGRAPLQGGDRVVEIDGTPLGNLALAERALACHQPGTTITITIRRGEEVIEIEVTLEAPSRPLESTPRVVPVGTTWLETRRRLRRGLAREGGSVASERAVEAALDWLSRHQEEDGSWSGDDWAKACPEGDPCKGPGRGSGGGSYRVGLTALSLLAFFGRGETQDSTPEGDRSFRPAIERALTWLLAQQDHETGAVGYDLNLGQSIYNHAFATQALCEAYGLTGDPRLRAPAVHALDFCLAAQNPGLGWKYGVRSGRNDSSVTGAMLQALLAGVRAGLAVPEAALDGGENWLRKATSAEGHVGYETPGGGSSYMVENEGRYALLPVMNGVSLASRVELGERRSGDELRRLARVLDRAKPEWGASTRTVNFYHWHWGTLASFQNGGTRWQTWNRALQKALLPRQRTDGHAKGSWDPVGEWCTVGGRVYATAINALTLEVYYREPRSEGAPAAYPPARPR